MTEPARPMSHDEFREAMDGLAAFMACAACACGDDEFRREHIRNGHASETSTKPTDD